MAKDTLEYAKMVENALRSVVREALACVSRDGMTGDHHFYISFRSTAPGVTLPDYLVARFPEEMTIVLQHQFWDLQVTDTEFSITLTFQNRPERLIVPFASVTGFTDPSVKFGLQFEVAASEAEIVPARPVALAPVPTAGSGALQKAASIATIGGPAKSEEQKAEERVEIERDPDHKAGAEVVTLDKFRKK